MLSEQQQRIMGYFIEEAKDHLNTIEQGLLNLQATIADPEMANEVFRAAHSVKGGAAMLGLTSIQHTAHRLEDYFKILKDCPLTIDHKLESLLLRVYDTLQELIEQLQGPFGLTDDKAEESMAAVEPVFTELNQLLSQLVSQSGAQPPEDVTLFTGTNAALDPVADPVSQIRGEESALRFIFQNDVPARLREMLQLFKQPDTPAGRQQLQCLCRELARPGEQLDLPGWCNLMAMVEQAIDCSSHSYRVLAPVAIKDIKRAQEQILAGEMNVVASDELKALLPEEPTAAEISVQDTAMDDLFGAVNAEDALDPFEAIGPVSREEMTLPEMTFEEALPEDTSEFSLNFDELGFEEPNSTAGLDALDMPLPDDDEMLSGLLDHQPGPEVGIAELNSLADLFEGEDPNLELTWQEESISEPEDQSSEMQFVPENDFSDLLFQDNSEDLVLEENEDLSDLFNNAPLQNGSSENSPETAATDFNFDFDAGDAGTEDLFLDSAALESIDPFSMTAIEVDADAATSDQSGNELQNLETLLSGLDEPAFDGVAETLEQDAALYEAVQAENWFTEAETNAVESDEAFTESFTELDLGAEFNDSTELDLGNFNLDETALSSDPMMESLDLFGAEATSEQPELNLAEPDTDSLDLDAFDLDSLNQPVESADFAADASADLEIAELVDLSMNAQAVSDQPGDEFPEFSETIDIAELEALELPSDEVGTDAIVTQPLSDPWTESNPDAWGGLEASELNLADDLVLDVANLNDEELLDSSELVAFHLEDPEIGADNLGLEGEAGLENAVSADFNSESLSEADGSSEDLNLGLLDEAGDEDWAAALNAEPEAEQMPADLDLNLFADAEEPEANLTEEFVLDGPVDLNDPFSLNLTAEAEATPAELVNLAEFELTDDLIESSTTEEFSDPGFDWSAVGESTELASTNDLENIFSDDPIDLRTEAESGLGGAEFDSDLFEASAEPEDPAFVAGDRSDEIIFDFGTESLNSVTDPQDGLGWEAVVSDEIGDATDSDLDLNADAANDLELNALSDLETPAESLNFGLDAEAADNLPDGLGLDSVAENADALPNQFDLNLAVEGNPAIEDLDLDRSELADLEDNFTFDLETEASHGAADEFDLNLSATDSGSAIDDFELGFDAAETDLNLSAADSGSAIDDFELGFDAAETDTLEMSDLTDSLGLDLGIEESNPLSGSSEDLGASDEDLFAEGFDLDVAATDNPDAEELILPAADFSDFDFESSLSSASTEESTDLLVNADSEEEAAAFDLDSLNFEEVDSTPELSSFDADESTDSLGLGLAGLGLAAGSTLFAANAAMDQANDPIDQAELTDRAAEAEEDADFLSAFSDFGTDDQAQENESFSELDFGFADLEPEAVEIEPMELSAPIALEPELADLDSFFNPAPSENTTNAESFSADSDHLARLDDEAAEMEDLDALLSDQDAAEPVAFDDLEAVLAEDDSLVTAIHEIPSAASSVGINETDDFADLEALLEDAPPVAASPLNAMSPVQPSPLVDGSLLSSPRSNSEDEFGDLEALLQDADQTLGVGSSPTRKSPAAANRRPSRRGGLTDQTMRVSVKHLDNLNNLVGEMVVNRNSLEQAEERLRQFLDNLLYQVQQLSDVGQRLRDLYERSLLESSLLSSRRGQPALSPVSGFNSGRANHATGASFDALEMDRFTGFHTLSQEMIELIVRVRESASDIDFVVEETDQVTRNFRQITTQLQEGLTRSRMVPFSLTADRLPRGVRDNSLKCGKQAELVIEGRDTLIDKMIVELLYDPMTHLVNNAVAHGIETPEERIAAGKSPTGRITIRAFHQGNQTVISVSDDGAGINPETVRAKALAKGLITATQAREMSRLDTYDLLFHHGFSTVDQADDLRGRGVGLDVVRSNLNEIRGTINIDSTIGKGTSFTIRLPLTLSISKALCCISNRARIAFPMDGVEDMLDVPKERVQTDEQGRPCIQWRDALLPFQPLAELLRYSRILGRGSVYGGNQEEDIISIVVLRSAGNFLALQVDQVLGEQEIVIKQLEGPVPKPVGVAGATVLGDGRIMPIADVLELIDLWQGRIRREPGASLWDKGEQLPPEPVLASEPTVLIVDDSITVRELLSMTFNKVGYRVEQARDGQEAWEKLRSGLPCDLVFCDIEMPRMDGLELLSRIQKDPHLSHLPIAMLTSRGADRHRQMAVQLGAKGYFTKPYLEEVLLDAAQRMLKGEVMVGG